MGVSRSLAHPPWGRCQLRAFCLSCSHPGCGLAGFRGCSPPVRSPSSSLCPSLELPPCVGVSRPGFPFPGCAGTGGRAGMGKLGFGARVLFGVLGGHFRGSGHVPTERTQERTLGCEQGLEPSCPHHFSPTGHFQKAGTVPAPPTRAPCFCRCCLTGEELSPGS